MQWIESIKRVQQLHELIKNEKTGTPCELACCFCISKRQLYNIIDDFKIMGADIKYSREKSTFYYTNGFNLKLDYHISFVDERCEKNIFGGNMEKILQSVILFH